MPLHEENEVMILYHVMPDGKVKFLDATHSLRLNHPDNHSEYKKRLAEEMQKIREKYAST